MRNFWAGLALLAAVGCLAATGMVTATAQGGPPGMDDDKDFSTGWNTLAEAAKGDWVEYKFTSGIFKRYEILDFDNGKVSLKIDTKPPGGETTEQKTRPQDWKRIVLISGRIPGEAQWATERTTRTVGEDDLECQTVAWLAGSTTTTIYFCKDVPCGGVVAVVINGKATLELTNWSVGGKVFGEKTPELPKFYSRAGNKAFVRETITSDKNDPVVKFKLVEVKKVEGIRVTLEEIPCDKDRKPLSKTKPEPLVKDAHDLVKPYRKRDIKDQKIKFGPKGREKEYTYDVVEAEEKRFTETSEYIVKVTSWIISAGPAEGLVIKKVLVAPRETTTIEVLEETSK